MSILTFAAVDTLVSVMSFMSRMGLAGADRLHVGQIPVHLSASLKHHLSVIPLHHVSTDDDTARLTGFIP